MPLNINLGSLASRVVRSTITASTGGTRKFSLNGLSTSTSGGIVSFIWNGFARFGGFLLGKVISLLFSALIFSFTALWGILIAAFHYVWTFNWNATDAQLDAAIKQGFVQLAGTFGATLGNALGYIVCGAIPGLLTATFNEPLAVHMLEEIGDEAADEIASNLANLIKQTGMQLVKMTMAWLYKNTRAFFRSGAANTTRKLIQSGAISQNTIDKAKASKDQPWSFAIAFNNLVESIPNQALQNFVEEFFDEFSDACIESGYIIAGSLDTFFASQRLANINFFGGTETIEIYPNRTLITPTTPTPTP